MVNRKLMDLAQRLGSAVPPGDGVETEDELRILEDIPIINGFEYVPSLELYVCKKLIFHKGYSWPDWKRSFRKEGKSMLTPEQFWKFYDHCVEKRPRIITDIRESNNPELLNAVVSADTGNPTSVVNRNIVDGLFMDRAKYVGDHLYSNGYFNREDVLPNGMPKELRQEGEFRYHGISGKGERVLMKYSYDNKVGFDFDYNILATSQANPLVGVRQCMKVR